MLGWLIGFIIIITLIIIADITVLTINCEGINDFTVDEDIFEEKKNDKGQESRENDIIINLEKIIRKGQ